MQYNTPYSNPYTCYLGMVEIDNEYKVFGILPEDRRRHVYIIGKSGMGKSTLLENMILQDIYLGHGVCFIDPLGDSCLSILDRIPNFRLKDVIYFDPSNTKYSLGLNLLDIKENESPALIVAEIMSIMERVWSGAWSARMEYILSNALLALIDIGGHNLMGALKMFSDQKFLEKIALQCQNMLVRNFWLNEYKQFPPAYKIEAVAAIQNKIGQLFANEMICNILGQTNSTIDFDDIMNNNKIFICNLAKGQIGESNCNLLGSIIVTKLQLSAMKRINISEKNRKDFYFYIDEFQNFINDSFISILSEARKFRLNITLAHQYLGQITSEESEKIRQAIFGNIGTIISFQIGHEDAEKICKEMGLDENYQYFTGLDIGQILIKESIQSKQLSTIFANTLLPLYTDFRGNLESVKEVSEKNWARPIAVVTKEIKEYYKREPVDNAKTRRAQRRHAERMANINNTDNDDTSDNLTNLTQDTTFEEIMEDSLMSNADNFRED
jgi:TraM recognition site of TraD and TraG